MRRKATLADHEQTLGAEHPLTATVRANLGPLQRR